MLIRTRDLCEALAAVLPGIAKKGMVDQSNHFMFSGEAVVTYNDRMCVSYPFPTDFQRTVESHRFYEILSGVEEGEVDLGVDGEMLRISAGGTRSKLKSRPTEGGLLDVVKKLGLGDENRRWRRLPGDFIQGIYLCLFSAAKDLTAPVLSSLLVQGKWVVSCDNNRISRYEFSQLVPGNSFMLPLSSALELVRYEVNRVSVDESWIHFRGPSGMTFSSRQVVGEYPKSRCSDYLDVKGERLTLPSGLKDAVEGTVVMSEDVVKIEERVCWVSVGGGVIVCRGQEAGGGWVEKEVPFPDYKGRTFSFGIQPVFFAQVLGKTTTMIISDVAARFESGTFEHVVGLHTEREFK